MRHLKLDQFGELSERVLPVTIVRGLACVLLVLDGGRIVVEHIVTVGLGPMPLDHVHFVLSYIELLLHVRRLLVLIRWMHVGQDVGLLLRLVHVLYNLTVGSIQLLALIHLPSFDNCR